MSFSKGPSKSHQRYLGNHSLFLSSIDDTTKKRLALKKLEMVRVLIAPECTVITDCNHIALYNHDITGLRGREGVVVNTKSDYGYDLGLEEEATNSTRPM